MTNVTDILNALEAAAPVRLAESYDNVGFLVGHSEARVTKVLVALDITGAVIDEAIREGAELIVAHHPIIFNVRKSVTDGDVIGSLLLKLIENKIAAICMHTNLDCASGGVNDVLARALEISVEGAVEPKEDGMVGGGRYGSLASPCELSEFLPKVCTALDTDGVRYHDAGIPVHRVAVGGGSCGEYITLAEKLGCDTVVTADIKHNMFLEAQELHINVVDAGHFATEDVVCPRMCRIISAAYPEVTVKIAEADECATRFFMI